ncbi:putative T7SS-secreted protein [Streptomyces sp. NPDC058657]|uniref:putative T7SS-secreted protein n=1 Tax=unclassified Streptomyces TaxID=2593676 RepID=UPI003653D003
MRDRTRHGSHSVDVLPHVRIDSPSACSRSECSRRTSSRKILGKGVDHVTDKAGQGLEKSGAHDWADAAEGWGDETAREQAGHPVVDEAERAARCTSAYRISAYEVLPRRIQVAGARGCSPGSHRPEDGRHTGGGRDARLMLYDHRRAAGKGPQTEPDAARTVSRPAPVRHGAGAVPAQQRAVEFLPPRALNDGVPRPDPERHGPPREECAPMGPRDALATDGPAVTPSGRVTPRRAPTPGPS